VPLPLGFEERPVVAPGAALGFAELAAGSLVIEPAPEGFACAKACELERMSAAANAIVYFISDLLNSALTTCCLRTGSAA
jgi:hypothetical protein